MPTPVWACFSIALHLAVWASGQSTSSTELCDAAEPGSSLGSQLLQHRRGAAPEAPKVELTILDEAEALRCSKQLGKLTPLTEDGFQTVAESCCIDDMKDFVVRAAEASSLQVCDQGGLNGFAPFFSCPDQDVSYEKLQTALRQETPQSENACPWLGSTSSECLVLAASCGVIANPTGQSSLVKGYVGLVATTNPAALVTNSAVTGSVRSELAQTFNVPSDAMEVTIGTGPLSDVSLLNLATSKAASSCTVYASYVILQTEPPSLDEDAVTAAAESMDATQLEAKISTAITMVAPEVGTLRITKVRSCPTGRTCKDKKLRDDITQLSEEAPSSMPRSTVSKGFFRKLAEWEGVKANVTCSHEIKQRSNYFSPVYNPTLTSKPATGFNSSIIWEDFTRSNWTHSKGGVFAAWKFRMGVPGVAEELPGGYMGAQVKDADTAALIFSVWDADRFSGSGEEKQFKSSGKLVWPLTDKKGERQPGKNGVICTRNCQDCGLPQLRAASKKGFTTGTQCYMAFNAMAGGGRWDIRMNRLRSEVTINTKDYQGMPEAHGAVGEGDRYITGAEWQVELIDDRNKSVEVGRLLFEGPPNMGISQMKMFDELLGCNKCDDVYHKNTRLGPFLADGRTPESLAWELYGATDISNTPHTPCLRARAYKGKSAYSVTLEAGPPVPHNGTLLAGAYHKIY